MSEYESELAKSIELYDVLGDGRWHPIISSLSIQRGEPTTFWVSEYFEHLGEDGPIHDRAEAFRVDFTSEEWTREGADMAAIGKTALIDMPHKLRLVTVEGRGYARIEHEIPKAAEDAFKKLMPHAAFVAGMPFETPLRWATVHGMNVAGGIGGECARYVMGDFGDGRKIMIYHDMSRESQTIGPWRLESKVPLPDGSGNYVETKITRTDSRPSVSVNVMSPEHSYLDSRQSTATDVIALIDLMNEAVAVLPEKQKYFMRTQQ